MKIALLSDIHGNISALEAVLEVVKSENVSTFLICGDFLGYYYNPKEVLERLISFHVVACKGNHELLFEQWLKESNSFKDRMLSKYGRGFQRAEESLTSEQIEWLQNLAHPTETILGGRKFLISHGSPWDLDLYLYENTINLYAAQFKELAKIYDVSVMGHSHYQFMRMVEGILVINPGSVGQPRSGHIEEVHDGSQARAQWAIFDTESMTVEFKTTFYDASSLFKKIAQNDPDINYLKSVLLRS